MLCSILRDPEHKLQTLDVSGNELTADSFELMRLSMTNNRTLTSLDIRNNPGYNSGTTTCSINDKQVKTSIYCYSSKDCGRNRTPSVSE